MALLENGEQAEPVVCVVRVLCCWLNNKPMVRVGETEPHHCAVPWAISAMTEKGSSMKPNGRVRADRFQS